MKISDKDYVQGIIQDLRIKLRDIDDYQEGKKLRKVIRQFESGFDEEYKKEF